MAKAEILIVEDNGVVAKDIQIRVKNMGFKAPFMVPSGEEAIEKIKVHKPDLVLMDIMLNGEMDGTEAAEQIRSRFHIPVVYLTAYADEKILEAAKLTEPFGYLIKPFVDKELKAVIEIALYRHKMEKKFEESEGRYRSLFEESKDAIVITDQRGEFIDVNAYSLDLFGYTKKEMTAMNFKDLYVNPEDGNRFQKEINEKGSVKGFEVRLRREDGGEMDCVFDVVFRRDDMGNISGYQGIIRDVTETKLLDEALRESEEKYRSMMESMNDPAYICSADFHVEYMNPAMVKRTGREAIGELCYEVINGFDEKCPWCVHDKAQQGEKCVTEITSPADNRTYSVSHSPIFHADGSISKLAIYRDITKIKNMEQQLSQAQKAEAIATLAGGMAHNFNNALTPIIGNVDLLQMEHGEDEKTMKCLEDMKISGLRMARLTSQLLAYAKGGKYNPHVFLLNDFVDATLPLVQYTLDPAVRVETNLPPDIMSVRADETQMQMVLSAIVANSNEAMEGPGCIRISTQNMDLDRSAVEDYPGLKPGPYVCISVEDDGKGMDEETKNRIFDPFFTTHFMGRGLGMASVYGVIENHDGTITVESETGKGTVVRIYLPAIEAKEEIKKEKVPEPAVELALGEGTILVIEDEESVMMIIRQILETFNYQVLEAETGKKAIELAETFDGQIDLALLDIRLPDMTGDKVYPLIMAARPNLKVIVCSGYEIEGPPQAILDAGAEGFIKKPFSVTAVADKLKEVLEGN